MTLLSAHQPCYLPWLGFWNKVLRSDIFVILDDVQFEKGSYINRTKIKTAQGEHWLTIPVPRYSYKKNISEIEIKDMSWVMNHYDTILHNYKKAECFTESGLVGIMNGYDRIHSIPPTDISELYDHVCSSSFEEYPYDWDETIGDYRPRYTSPWEYEMYEFYEKEDEAEDKIFYQSDSRITGNKQGLIINLCHHYNADAFLFGAKGRDYVDVHYFEAHGITPLFQDFKCIEYPQQWGGAFVPGLSIIDALFNVGPKKTMDLIKGGYDIPKKY